MNIYYVCVLVSVIIIFVCLFVGLASLRRRKNLAFVIRCNCVHCEGRVPEKVYVEVPKAWMGECAKVELDW